MYLYYEMYTDQSVCVFFFFNDTATTEIYTLSLHDALPISFGGGAADWISFGLAVAALGTAAGLRKEPRLAAGIGDRKSTRLNSSHANISYAVFCLKKKTQSMKY